MTHEPSKVLNALERFPDWFKGIFLVGCIVIVLMFLNDRHATAQEQVSRLREDVAALKESRTTLKTEVDSLKSAVLRIEGKMDVLILTLSKK
jgi:hypothetical protein